MKVTVNLEMTDTQWGYVVDKAERCGTTVEDYIATVSIYGSNSFDQEQYS